MSLAYGYRVAAHRPRICGLPEEWFHLSMGLLLAPVFTLTPFLQLVGWFFRALVHEMGHAAASWLIGAPAIPALGITAEAATVHGEQEPIAAFVIWGVLFALIYHKCAVPQRYIALGILSVLLPTLSFSSLSEAWHLLSGHLAELAVGGLFLGRAMSGGFSKSQVERALYATMGWSLIGQNLFLTAGLMTSASARAEYAANGSFGIENDYMRLADWAGTSLESCAMLMTLVAFVVAPAVIGLWIVRSPRED